jgi:hypothetical protein
MSLQSFLSVVLMTLVLNCSVFGQKKPQPIPDGYDFPAEQSALLRLRDSNDVAGMRRHSWLVFAGMTEPTSTGEAVWETWYSGGETFGAAPPQGLADRQLQHKFQVPRQFRESGLHPQAIGASLASMTLFNEELRTFVRQKKLYLRSTLKSINDSFSPETPVDKREIPEFPNRAIALKTVWWIVKRQGMTVMPIWDAGLNPPLPGGNDFPTWKRCVAVDPNRPTIPAGETKTSSCNQASPAALTVVPLASFYHFSLTAEDISALRDLNVFIPNLDDTTAAGDFLALIALHYTTKEVRDWVWATFWWHDKPSDGTFAANRPSEVKGVWRNYLMDTSYSMDTPAATDGGPHAAFNPWLEARFRNGPMSNCMTCHRRAVFSGQSSDGNFLPVTRGAPAANDPRFVGATKLDFLWSVLLESLPDR